MKFGIKGHRPELEHRILLILITATAFRPVWPDSNCKPQLKASIVKLQGVDDKPKQNQNANSHAETLIV